MTTAIRAIGEMTAQEIADRMPSLAEIRAIAQRVDRVIDQCREAGHVVLCDDCARRIER